MKGIAVEKKMRLFDEGERTNFSDPIRSQSHYDYLNTSAREEAVEIRRVFQTMFEAFPEADKGSLFADFTSDRNETHLAAVLELVTFSLLVSSGNRCLAVHPELPKSEKQPDFLFENAQGEKFYVECVYSQGVSSEQSGAKKRKESVLEIVDQIDSPIYWLDVDMEGEPRSPPSLKKIRASLQKFVDELPNDFSEEVLRDFPEKLAFQEEFGGASLIVKPFSRRAEGGPQRTIGLEFGGVSWHSPGTAAKNVLKKKAARYGELDAPFLIVVGGRGSGFSAKDVDSTLYGLTTSRLGDDKIFRTGDTLLSETKNTRVSAVLSICELNCWSLASRKGVLHINPWANCSLPDLGLKVSKSHFQLDGFSPGYGAVLGESFDLPEGWPEVTLGN